ncbi:MAG: hypothetical protein WAK92_04950 [Thiobacillus sp.]
MQLKPSLSDTSLRRILALVIALLLIHQVGVLIASLWGMAWGAVSALVVAGVTFFSVRLAKRGGRSSAWFLLPTLLFTVLPLLIMLWKIVGQEAGWTDRLVALLPLLIGFVAPVLLLLAAYFELRGRTRRDQESSSI